MDNILLSINVLLLGSVFMTLYVDAVIKKALRLQEEKNSPLKTLGLLEIKGKHLHESYKKGLMLVAGCYASYCRHIVVCDKDGSVYIAHEDDSLLNTLKKLGFELVETYVPLTWASPYIKLERLTCYNPHTPGYEVYPSLLSTLPLDSPECKIWEAHTKKHNLYLAQTSIGTMDY